MSLEGQPNGKPSTSNSFCTGDISQAYQLNSSNPLKHAQSKSCLLRRTEKAIYYLKELITDLESTRKDLLSNNNKSENKENANLNLKQSNSSIEDGKRKKSLLYRALDPIQKDLKTQLLQIIDIITDLQKFSYLKTHTRLPSDLSSANSEFMSSKKSFKSKTTKNSILLDLDNLAENFKFERNSNFHYPSIQAKGSANGMKNDGTLPLVPEMTFVPFTFVNDNTEGLFKEENMFFQDISPIHFPESETKLENFDYLTNLNDQIKYEEKCQDSQKNVDLERSPTKMLQNDREKEMSTELSIEFEVVKIESERLFVYSSSIQNYDMVLRDLDSNE